MIKGITMGDLSIDAVNPEKLRDFYAVLTGWEKRTAYDCPAVVTENGLLVLFMNVDCGYAPPVLAGRTRQATETDAFQFSGIRFVVCHGGSHTVGCSKSKRAVR